MFKFGFSKDDEAAEDKKPTRVEWYDSKQIIPGIAWSGGLNVEALAGGQLGQFCCRSLTVQHVSAKEVVKGLKEIDQGTRKLPVIEADERHSDLVTGKYEGGLKIWECTTDLAEHLLTQLQFDVDTCAKPLVGQQVLDLGCGAGIMGIVCMLLGARVTFQDYNEEVLVYATIPNVMLNCGQTGLELCNFYSGDWSSFLQLILQGGSKYDVIVSSETIYNTENYSKISDILVGLLKEDGHAWVAAKACYFGVGGSVAAFQEHLQLRGDLNCRVAMTADEDVKRQVLHITHKHKCMKPHDF